MDQKTEMEQAATGLRSRWAKAFAARDLEALSTLYTPDVLFFGSRPELFRGRPGVRAYFDGLAPDVRLDGFDPPDLIEIAPGVFGTAGFWRFHFGPEARRYRLTWVVVARDGGWLLAQHHAARVDS